MNFSSLKPANELILCNLKSWQILDSHSNRPVIYSQVKQKQYDSKFNKTFGLRGYKHISNLAAVGHRTDENLKIIKKSLTKTARSVEFDP